MRKMKRIFTVLLLSAIVSVVSFISSASASGNEVQLIQSNIETYNYGQVIFSGSIEVENLGFSKDVTVHYTTDDITWYETDASYVRPTDSSHEQWNFSIETSDALPEHPELDDLDFVRFAIEYNVNSNTYWDNNNSLNYYNKPTQIGSFSIYLGNVNVIKYSSHLIRDYGYVDLHLKNLGPIKTVKIVYTIDNWVTTNESYASYSSPSNFHNSVEHWGSYLPVPYGTTEIEYAISYTVNGSTYWDNNYGNNYTIVN